MAAKSMQQANLAVRAKQLHIKWDPLAEELCWLQDAFFNPQGLGTCLLPTPSLSRGKEYVMPLSSLSHVLSTCVIPTLSLSHQSISMCVSISSEHSSVQCI